MASIEELEGVRWPPPADDATSVIRRCHELRRVCLGDLTPEGLRLLVSQRVGEALVLPAVVRLLVDDPLVSGDMFFGDLLAAVLRLPPDAWAARVEEREALRRAVSELVNAPPSEGRWASVDQELRTAAAAFVAQ
ncbi:MAG: hypothetical protein KQH57_03170 [Actinomycetales bacterium]|nr:hypothetical protein [Actinomycetales bacterium]